MRTIQIIILILLLSSCNSEKRLAKRCAKCQSSTEVMTKEVIKITPFDTTLFISQMGKDILFPDAENGNCCEMVDSLNAMMARGNGTISANNGGIKSSVFKQNKKIVFRCEADSLKKVIEGLRTEITTSTSKTITKTIELPCSKEHKDWLDKYDRPWFFISLGAFLLFIGLKLFKMRATLLKLFTTNPFK